MALSEKLEAIFQNVVKRNPGEAEFHHAAREVLEALGPVLAKYPEFSESKIIERICEPERQLIFRVQFNSALGPYKGARAPTSPGFLKVARAMTAHGLV